MLVRLRPGALGGVDDEQEEVDSRRPGDHRPDEPLVPGDVDEREAAPVRRARAARSRGRSRSRAPAPRAAGRCPCRSAPGRAHVLPWSTCPAVPTTSGMRSTAAATSSASASVSVRQSSSVRPSRTTPIDGRLAGAGAPPRAPPRPRRRSSAARPAAARRRRPAPPSPRPRRRPPRRAAPPGRAPPASGSREHPQRRGSRSGALEQERERPLERRERELVGAQRPLERVPAQPLDEVGAAGDDPGLRPAEQLVAREADEVGAGGEARSGGRLALERDERAGAEIVDERKLVPAGDRGELVRARGCSVKPTTRKFDWCTRSRSAVSGPIARLVVRGARPVRRPDLDAAARPSGRARRGSGSRRRSRSARRARRRTSRPSASAASASSTAAALLLTTSAASAPGEAAQQRREVILARAAGAGGRGRTRGSSSPPPTSRHAVERGLRERGAAEVRVHEHAGRVEDAARAAGRRSALQLGDGRSARSPGSTPARISSRARSSAVRAAASASSCGSAASRSSRSSSSTDGRSRRRMSGV